MREYVKPEIQTVDLRIEEGICVTACISKSGGCGYMSEEQVVS